MVKRKRMATKSRTAEPMDSPATSSDSKEKVQQASPAANPSIPVSIPTSEARNSESDLPPLPKVMAPDQHAITSFRKAPLQHDKGKQVKMDQVEEKQTKSVAKSKEKHKLTMRKSVRKKPAEKATPTVTPKGPSSKAKASSVHTKPQVPMPGTSTRPKKVAETAATPSIAKKKKSEVEMLGTPSKVSTRQRK